jgi:hypothetical protein
VRLSLAAVILALRDISPGEEITLSYIGAQLARNNS